MIAKLTRFRGAKRATAFPLIADITMYELLWWQFWNFLVFYLVKFDIHILIVLIAYVNFKVSIIHKINNSFWINGLKNVNLWVSYFLWPVFGFYLGQIILSLTTHFWSFVTSQLQKKWSLSVSDMKESVHIHIVLNLFMSVSQKQKWQS